MNLQGPLNVHCEYCYFNKQEAFTDDQPFDLTEHLRQVLISLDLADGLELLAKVTQLGKDDKRGEWNTKCISKYHRAWF
jgi:hypothetical protein